MTEEKVKRKSHSDMLPRNCPRCLMIATLVPAFAIPEPHSARLHVNKEGKTETGTS